MIAEVQVISNHGWNIMYLLFGAGVGVIGAVAMMVWEEVRDDREANEDGSRNDAGDGSKQGGQRR